MPARSPLVPLSVLVLFAPVALASEPPPPDLLSVRPTVFLGSEDLDHGRFDSQLHLGVTGRTHELAPGLTAELELSLLASSNFALSDNSSFLRFHWRPSGWSDLEGLSVTLLPFHSDRLYLGYEFPLTDLVGAYSSKATVTGTEIRLQRQRGYVFAAMKSTMTLDGLTLEAERVFTVMGGAGAELLPGLRLEAEASHADLGWNPGYANQGRSVKVGAWGAAARILHQRGSPIGPPANYERYQDDPARWEKLLQPETYDDQLSTSLSAELLYLSQSGLQNPASGQPDSQSGVGYALEGRAKWRGLRGFLRAQSRSAELLWTSGPGLPPNNVFPKDADAHREVSASAAADYHFWRTGLTPGLSLEWSRPASLVVAGIAGSAARTLVFGPHQTLSVLPQGANVDSIWQVMGTLRWDLGQLSALADAFYRRDPNQTTFAGSTTGIAEPSFVDPTSWGFDLLIQTRF